MKYINFLILFQALYLSVSSASEIDEEISKTFWDKTYLSSRLYAGDYSSYSEAFVFDDDKFKYRLGGIFLFRDPNEGVEVQPEFSIEKKLGINRNLSFYVGLGAVKDEPTFEYEMVYDTKVGFTLNTGYRFFLDDEVVRNRNQFYIGFDIPIMGYKTPVREKVVEKLVEKPVLKKESKTVLSKYSVNFDNNSTSFIPNDELLALVERMLLDANARVVLRGFANSIGDYNYNLTLSKKRAESVRQFLINNGVEGNRISVSGLGESSLILRGKSEDLELSRRVVILYYSN